LAGRAGHLALDPLASLVAGARIEIEPAALAAQNKKGPLTGSGPFAIRAKSSYSPRTTRFSSAA